MARFRDNTLSSTSSRAGRRSSSRLNATALPRASSQVRVEHAKKVRKGKEVAVKRATYRSYHFRYVYVGNLRSDVTEEYLKTCFRRAGEVTRIVIRAAGGSVSVGPAVDAADQDKSYIYASVEFKSSFAANRALRLHGTKWNDSQIFVTQDVLKLPEFQKIQRQCEEKTESMDPAVAAMAALQAKWHAFKRVTVNRTEVVPLNYAAGGNSKGQYQQQLKPLPRKPVVMASVFSVLAARIDTQHSFGMETMSRSPALNPSSTPFFPGGAGAQAALAREDESKGHGLGFKVINREQFNNSTSSLSISPSDYRSVVSSPSPSSQDGRDTRGDASAHYQAQNDFARHSPGIGGVDTERFLMKRPSSIREPSMSSVLETIPDTEDAPGLAHANGTNGSMIPNALYTTVMGRNGRLNTPPVAIEPNNNRSASFSNLPLMSSSPASSMDSGMFASSVDVISSLENQLKYSPVFNDVLDRLVRLEANSREIQHQVTDVDRKVRVLLERYINTNTAPEFSNPFATNPASQSFSAGPRGSIIGNIAPNQVPPPEDMADISQRLHSISSTVDQLLNMSAAQKMQIGGSFSGAQMLGSNAAAQIADFNPRMVPLGMANGNGLGHGLPGGRADMRPNQRMSNPPMRTWSAGTLDLPPRASESGPSALGRPDIFRDKRRSVSTLSRRDSAGGESLMSNQSSRDGPTVTKWEQLALAPDLLRSLSTFGVGPPNKIQQRALPFLLKGADIIAQAPPTQERIAAYVIPAIHTALVYGVSQGTTHGPVVVMISTTVDQATQAQRMIRDLGGPVGVKSALGVGSASVNSDNSQELRLLQQNMPHIICGTPQKLHALFTSPGGLSGSEVRFLVLDEVDQLIARNLHDFVFNIVKLLPPARSRPLGSATPTAQTSFTNLDNGSASSLIPPNQNRRLSVSPVPPLDLNGSGPIERQTALFSNTVPQDVLNLATAIQLREPVRVLVRRDGNVTHADTSQGARALRQFYLYLAFTAGGRSEAPLPATGLGIIGSGRGASSAETAQAREWKLDALADLFDDLDVPQAVIHVGGMTSLDAVVYKLASRGLDAVPLHGDMNAGTKLAALNKFRSPPTPTGVIRQTTTKILVVYDVQVKPPEVAQVPLIINYDLPKAVEEYAHRVAPANASGYSRAGVVVNFVTATGGDVEMLRSIECFYKIKCPEVPMSLRDIV
ncbi:hypothetical protein EIP91_011121 [Steccherinum ochraceum]|uniref:RNA helicase n=1 Tax=Steccherinum ochraceum TaxID=92696 RepID=A0A4R0RR31_9APHY|nr:hypothetical protein EIP91_011121 [Steccherinum ochraceum]